MNTFGDPVEGEVTLWGTAMEPVLDGAAGDGLVVTPATVTVE